MARSFNCWLPPPVVDELNVESERFRKVVERVQEAFEISTLKSRLDSIQWISVVNTFLRAKSGLEISDVEALVKAGLDIVFTSTDSLYIQTRWANCLSRVLSKYHKRIKLEIDWRKLYDLLLNIHFSRRVSYEGLSLKQSHLQNIIYLIETCRRFFKAGSCAEIWAEFRPKLEDVSHNSALEAVGFLSLFLSTKSEKDVESDQAFFTRSWLEECLQLWSAIPNCHYWNVQWASLLSRCIKHRVLTPLDCEPLLPQIFSIFLNSFEVPVGKSGVRSPTYRRIPSEIKAAFYTSWSSGLSALSAKSIVYLLSPRGSAQSYFDMMIDLLEQYYHPSNGGSWTGSLQRFLRLLVFYFMKRLENENCVNAKSKELKEQADFLGQPERAAFVTTIMKLIERGQYSKNDSLAWTAASAASRLSYVEPSIVLPVVVNRFQMALETVTATHQLESALRMLALSSRSLLIYDAYNDDSSREALRKCLMDAMFATLPGLDANDSPKTISTMQFYCCVLSSVGSIDTEDDKQTSTLPIDWSLWVDEFLDRLFTLFVNLEPSVQTTNDAASEVGFLTESGSPYSCLVELLFSKMSESQYQKALKRTTKFVIGNILPGAVEEVGLLCCNLVSANPTESCAHLVAPIMESLIESLSDSPKTGFGGQNNEISNVDFKVGLSPALEMTARYYIGVISRSIFYGGAALSKYKSLMKQVITASFDAPSSKVNDAGCNLLASLISGMAMYYPTNVFKSASFHMSTGKYEDWVVMKDSGQIDKEGLESLWHVPDGDELAFINEVIDMHLMEPLAALEKICDEKDDYKSKYAGQEKEHLRVLLLRVEGVLCGLGTSLPDFNSDTATMDGGVGPLTVVGSAGARVGSTKLREEVSRIIHQVCQYLLNNRGDDSVLLKILVLIIDMVGNYGTIEYHSYLNMKSTWDESARLLTEPCTNFVNNSFSAAKRRPWWLVIQRAFIHNLWRASQSGYRCYKEREISLPVSSHVIDLLNDLLKLSLHSYSGVRSDAARSLKSMLQRYPSLVKKCIPVLTETLKDPKATKEAALGSCEILMSRSVIRHLRQDWTGLTRFLVALLGSAHHESVEAQDAINTLFIVFNTSFGGVPAKTYLNGAETDGSDVMTYSSMVSYVRNLLKGDSITIHWRYNLMAHGILLCLVLTVMDTEKQAEDDIVSDLRHSVAGGFLNNLKSELPPLRPLSVIALLFLLEATPCIKNGRLMQISDENSDDTDDDTLSLESSMANVLHDHKFGENVVNKLAIDKQSSDEDGSYKQFMSDGGLTLFMPTNMRDWPYTRTWDVDMQGEQFSPTFAKLFKRLVQKFGSVVLKVLRGPLEEVPKATDDRGKQCIAAEIMAGILHSDAECVISAWDEWICSLFQKFLVLPTLDSASEWAACIRFAVSGKGSNGSRIPLMRTKVIQCVAECIPERSSTTLTARKLMFLRAAIVELLPVYSPLEEIVFQSSVLKEVLQFQNHSSPQVRRTSGSVLCLLLTNLRVYSELQKGSEDLSLGHVSEQTCSMLVDSAYEATKSIINADETNVENNEVEGHKKKNKEPIRKMETIFYFLAALSQSGRACILMNTVIRLIYPTLSLQETSEKDLSSLARGVLRYLQWQGFSIYHLPEVVKVTLAAANDNYWHTRVAFLTFLQSFLYRHKFVLSHSDQESLWVRVMELLSDPQLEVRESAAKTLSGMMKGAESTFAKPFRQKIIDRATEILSNRRKKPNRLKTGSIPAIHGVVLGLSAVILAIPYDMPNWLPDIVTLLAEFASEPWPIRGTVTKAITDFRHTHSDMWQFQRELFTEQQLEVLSNLSSSATYFA